MSTDQQKWFKNPWVWLIIALPMSAVIGGIITIIITNKNQPDMVMDDYYKKGKAINQELTLFENAKKMGIELDIKIHNHKLELRINHSVPALKVTFSHSTLARRDFELVATQNAQGIYTALFDQDIEGKWLLFVGPMDDSWKLKTTLALPQEDWVRF